MSWKSFQEVSGDNAATTDLIKVLDTVEVPIVVVRRDTMIAGIVLAQHATLATRNTAHFDDFSVPLVNPWVA